MADPRGLSGAVFQPTPVRDFIQDLQRQQQITGQALSRAQKAQEDFFDSYAFDVDENKIPDPYMDSYLPQVDAYRNKSKEVFALKDSDPMAYRQGLRELDNMRSQLKLGAAMSRERYKTGTGYKGYLDKHGKNLEEGRRNEILSTGQQMVTPTERFEFREDGALYFGDRPVADVFSDNVVLSEPQGPKVDWRDGMLNQTANGVNGFKYTVGETGAVGTNKQQVYDSFDDAYASGSPYAVEGVKEQISLKLNKPIDSITDEQVQAQVEADPSLVDRARDSYYRYVDQGISKKSGREDSGSNEGFVGFEKTKGRYYQFGDVKNAPNKFAVKIAPTDNIKISAELDAKDEKTEKPTTKTVELKVSDIIKGTDGKLYVRAYDRISDEFIPVDGPQRAQLEAQLKIKPNSLEEWFEYKKNQAGFSDDKSGMPPSIPNEPSTQPPLEPQKKTVKDILKPKG